MATLTGSPLAKFRTALKRSDVVMFYDLREARMMMIADKGDPIPCDDRAMAWLRFKFHERFTTIDGKGNEVPYQLAKQTFYDLRDAVGHENQRDTFKEWLLKRDGLTLKDEDVEDYGLAVDWMVSDALGGDEGVYARWISRMILLSAVWRTMEPGCKHHEVPVLKGPQGVGKDSILTSLAPWDRLCTTTFSFALSQTRQIEVTRGCLFVIASEMGGVTTTKDLEALKSYITTEHDDMRLAYGRDKEVMPRRFVFACTTNLERPLPNDATGNRRWAVVEVGESRVGRVEDWVVERRDRLWGEALALYRMGVSATLPRDMKGLQVHSNCTFERLDEQMEDAYESAIYSNRINVQGKYTLTELAVAMQICETPEDFRREKREVQHRLRDELQRQGWTSRRARHKQGKVKRLWYNRSQCNEDLG